MVMWCQPSITMHVHQELIANIERQRDMAVREYKLTFRELELTTNELKELTRTMREQTNTIRDLESKLVELSEPDLSIYDDTMKCPSDDVIECECDRTHELRTIETCVLVCLIVALLIVAVAHSKTLSIMDL